MRFVFSLLKHAGKRDRLRQRELSGGEYPALRRQKRTASGVGGFAEKRGKPSFTAAETRWRRARVGFGALRGSSPSYGLQALSQVGWIKYRLSKKTLD